LQKWQAAAERAKKKYEQLLAEYVKTPGYHQFQQAKGKPVSFYFYFISKLIDLFIFRLLPRRPPRTSLAPRRPSLPSWPTPRR